MASKQLQNGVEPPSAAQLTPIVGYRLVVKTAGGLMKDPSPGMIVILQPGGCNRRSLKYLCAALESIQKIERQKVENQNTKSKYGNAKIKIVEI